MLKQSLALIGLTLSISANAAMVTTTYQATIGSVIEGGNASYIGQTFTIAITYDDAGTEMHQWNDGVNGLAEAGGGDDTLNRRLNLSPSSFHSFFSDADFSFSNLPAFGGTPNDVQSTNQSRASQSPLNFVAILEEDHFSFRLNDSIDPTGDDIFSIYYFTEEDGNQVYFGTISAVPLPAAAWLFGSALLGLVAVKRNKA